MLVYDINIEMLFWWADESILSSKPFEMMVYNAGFWSDGFLIWNHIHKTKEYLDNTYIGCHQCHPQPVKSEFEWLERYINIGSNMGRQFSCESFIDPIKTLFFQLRGITKTISTWKWCVLQLHFFVIIFICVGCKEWRGFVSACYQFVQILRKAQVTPGNIIVSLCWVWESSMSREKTILLHSWSTKLCVQRDTTISYNALKFPYNFMG